MHEMTRYTEEHYTLICTLLHQAVCERKAEPDRDAIQRGKLFSGDVERAFALAILEEVLGLRSDATCRDCDEDPVLYMVHDSVWQAAGMKYDDGWLCMTCLEKRLGRPLEVEDLTDAPCNAPWATTMIHKKPRGDRHGPQEAAG